MIGDSVDGALLCPKCRGRRTVLDPVTVALSGIGMFGVGLALFALADAVHDDEDDKILRKPCPVCRGKGWLRPPQKKARSAR